MRILSGIAVAALAAGLAGCGQGDGGNVMGAGANSLTPEQVDAALGPEIANGPGNAIENADNGADAQVGDQPPAGEPAARRPAPTPSAQTEDNEPDTPVQDDDNAL